MNTGLDSASQINAHGQRLAARRGRRFATRVTRERVRCNALLRRFFALVTTVAISRAARSASLTAAAVGNASESSGSIRTRFVAARNRLTYFPRTPPFMEAKSYSGRISLTAVLRAFFIESPLSAGRSPSTDDTNGIAFFR